MTGVAEAKPKPGEMHCTSPIFQGGPVGWRDLNLRYSIRDRIIGPPPPANNITNDGTAGTGCLELFAGEHWVRAVPPWLTAPDDTNQDGIPDKIAEFQNKFEGARYVIDEKTGENPSQQNIVKANKTSLFTGVVPEGVQPPPNTPPVAGAPFIVLVSPRLPKLDVTKVCDPIASPPILTDCHTSTLYVTMSDQVCTGRGVAPGLSTDCLPKGESKWPISTNVPFKVSPEPTGN